MNPRKFFFVFIILSLALTSFLVGYVLVGQEIENDGHHRKLATVPIVKTNTLLDRFEGEVADSTKKISTQQGPSSPETITKKFLNLDPNINTYAISPDNQKVAYFIPPKKEGGEGNIFVSDLDGSNQKFVFKTRVANLSLGWVDKNQLSIDIDPLKEPIVLKITP